MKFKRTKSENITFWFLILLSIVLIILSNNKLLNSVELGGFSVFSKFENVFNNIGDFFKNTSDSIKKLSILEKEYDKARKELNQYYQVVHEFENIKQENKKLKEVLGFTRDLSYKNVPAKVIAKDPNNVFNTVTLNKGESDGVKKNMPVLAIQNGRYVLAGKIYETSNKYSIVLPIFNMDNYVSVKLNKSKYQGLLSSYKNLFNTMQMNIYYEDILEEELKNFLNQDVLTSNLSSLYQDSLYIGKVIDSIKNSNDEIELKVKIDLNFSSLEYLYVIVEDKN